MIGIQIKWRLTKEAARSIAAGVGSPLVALLIQKALWSTLKPLTWILFYPAILISTALGGVRAGMLTIGTSLALGWYFFILPEAPSAVAAPRHLATTFIFIVLGTFLSLLKARTDKFEAENKEHIARLTDAELKYRSLFETAGDSILVVDKNHVIQMANPQCERMFGYSAMELVGQSIEILLPENLRQLHSSHQEKYMASPESRAMGTGLDLLARRKDGSLFPVDITLSYNNSPDSSACVTTVVRDCSERKRAEKQQALLARLGETLSKSLNLKETLPEAAQLLADSYCEWATIDLLLKDGSSKRIAIGARNRKTRDLESPHFNTESGFLRPFGSPDSTPDAPPVLNSTSPPQEEAPVSDSKAGNPVGEYKPKTTNAMILPLSLRGTTLGTLTLAFGIEIYGPADLKFAQTWSAPHIFRHAECNTF